MHGANMKMWNKNYYGVGKSFGELNIPCKICLSYGGEF